MVVASGFSPSVPTIATTTFTPTNGKHYRLVLGGKDSRSTIAVLNAKVVVDQAGSAGASIAVDASSVGTASAVSPLAWSHTVGAGSNTFLVVSVVTRALTSAPSVSAVSYNSVAMTKIRADNTSTTGAGGTIFYEMSLWVLKAPTTGANSISVTWSGGGASPQINGAATSYTGVSQVNTADASNSAAGTAAADNTFNITTVADNTWIYAVAVAKGTNFAPTVTPDQTARSSGTLFSVETLKTEDTNAAQTPAGSHTVGFNISGGAVLEGWLMSGMSFAPVAPVLITKLEPVYQIANTKYSTAPIAIADSYSEANSTGTHAFVYTANYGAHSFTGNGQTLNKATWYIEKDGSPTGNVVAKIYNTSGTFGTNSLPTGAALATSNTVNSATLPASFTLTDFTFSGANKITLTNGTHYALTLEGDVGAFGNMVDVAGDDTSPTHGGDDSFTSNSGSTWNTQSGQDAIFYIYTDTPQQLQNYITDFDPAEWSTTNNYLHAVDAADNSASVAGIYDTSGTLQINSTVTSPDNFATSTTGFCVPAVQTNLDTKATTNNNDLYGDEIIVQVGVASTATGCAGTPVVPGKSTVTIKAQMIIREPTTIK